MDSESFLSLLLSIHFYAAPFSSIVVFVITIVLLIIATLISASEIVFRTVSSSGRKEIEESEDPADKKLQFLFANQERILSSILIWIVFIYISIIILSVFAMNRMVDYSSNPILWLIIQVIILAILILFFGEIIPKIVVRNNPLQFIRKVAPVLKFLDAIAKPLSIIFVNLSNFFNRPSKRKVNDVSADELSKALELTSGELTEEKEMLQGIIELYNKTAVEIMTSRMDMADLDINTGFKEVIQYIIEVGYSRIPVYAGNQDDIRGILYSKDLLPYLNKHAEFRWQTLIRAAFFVPENKKIDDLLEDFRKNKIHMAIVVDEFGGTSGIVTMEDILEEIVGEIDDEYDDEELKYTNLGNGSYIFDAKISIAEFFRITHIDPKVFGSLTDEVDTLAGLILEIKGDFPEEKEIVLYENYSFQILEMDKKRILKVKFIKENHPEEAIENEN